MDKYERITNMYAPVSFLTDPQFIEIGGNFIVTMIVNDLLQQPQLTGKQSDQNPFNWE